MELAELVIWIEERLEQGGAITIEPARLPALRLLVEIATKKK